MKLILPMMDGSVKPTFINHLVYQIDVPDDFEPVPLIFMLHGLGGTGADNYGFTPLAEDSCFMVVFPSGMYNTWNAGPQMHSTHEIDDNSYLDALIDTIFRGILLTQIKFI